MTSSLRPRQAEVLEPAHAGNLLEKGHWSLIPLEETPQVLKTYGEAKIHAIRSEDGQDLAYVVEPQQGLASLLTRLILRARRPIHADIVDAQGMKIMKIFRPFHWLWSTLYLSDALSRPIGEVRRRFGAIIDRKYEIVEGKSRVFARLTGGIFKFWNFTFRTADNRELGRMSKKMGNLLSKDGSTDRLLVEVDRQAGGAMSLDRRALILAAALAIEFDYFEKIVGSKGLLFQNRN